MFARSSDALDVLRNPQEFARALSESYTGTTCRSHQRPRTPRPFFVLLLRRNAMKIDHYEPTR